MVTLGLTGTLAAHGSDFSADLAHGELVGPVASGGGSDFLEPRGGLFVEFLEKALALRFPQGCAVDDGLWGIGESTSFYLRIEYVTTVDAKLLPDGQGDDHLKFIFDSDNGHNLIGEQLNCSP